MGLMANLKAQRAYSLQAKGQTEEARTLYEQAMAGGLDNPRYMLGYSVLLLRSQEYAKARELLVRIQKLPLLTAEQKSSLFTNYAACVYRMGEIDKGIHLLERQCAKAPTGNVYQTLGYLYVEKYARENTPDFDAMVAQQAAAAEASPVSSEDAAMEQQPAESAAGAEEKPDPQQPEALTPRQAWEAGIEKARSLIQTSVDYDDEDSICLDNMGQFLYRVIGDKEAAKPWFEKAHAIKDSQIDTLYFLSRYDLEAGDREAAAKKLEKILEGRFSPLNYATKEMAEEELKTLRG